MAIGKVIRKVIPKKEVARRLQARPKTTTKKKEPKSEPLQKSFMRDAVSRYGVKRDVDKLKSKAAKMDQQAREGATPSAKKAMSSKEKDKLARQKAAAGSFKRAQGLKKGSIKQLEDAYDKLTAGAKRAERLKGTESEYYEVFKKRGFKPMKKGGKTDPYAEGTGTPKGTKGTPPPSIFDQKKKKKNYGGKVMYKKYGGKVGGSDGNKLVASCYD
jgi:hypothetical protein